MRTNSISSHLNILENHIDIGCVPFSDRGSRVLVFRTPGESRLYVRLAERLSGLEPGLEAYRQRPPFISDLCLIDEQGESLDFEICTYPHALYFHTRLGDFGLAFQDESTLAIGLPAGRTAGVRFHVAPEFWRATSNGGVFKAVRNLVYASNGQVVYNEIRPQGGGYEVDLRVGAGDDASVALHVSGEAAAVCEALPFSQVQTAAEARWHGWFEQAPRVAERYRRTYTYAWWVMANNLISPLGRVVHECMMPSKITYVGLWQWDCALHALAYRHVDAGLARNQIRAMLACQAADGMLPDAVYDEGVICQIDHPFSAQVTKPPIMAWAALKIHELAPDLEFLREVYGPLVRNVAWWMTLNDDDGDGIAQYNHPYSSGLDDNPLWDYGMPVESPDLNTYLCLQMQSLAVMADGLGLQTEAQLWRRRAGALVRRMVEDMWDEEAGVFRALHEERPIPVLTPFNLLPLWTGELSAPMQERLVANLTDPRRFWGAYPLPSVARTDPQYDAQTMWRGPVWANLNYFFIEALTRVGEHDLAVALRDKTLEMVAAHPSIYEYYNAETGVPPATAADIFGWTAAVFIDLAIRAGRDEGDFR